MPNILNMLKKKLISYLLGNEIELLLLQKDAEIKGYQIEIINLENERDNLYVKVQKNKKREVPVAGFDDLSAEPQDTKERRQYCADVQVFYDNILHSKIKNAVAETRHLLSNVNKDENMPSNMSRSEYDFFVRGMEAGFWAINDWAVRLSGELQENKYTINE